MLSTRGKQSAEGRDRECTSIRGLHRVRYPLACSNLGKLDHCRTGGRGGCRSTAARTPAAAPAAFSLDSNSTASLLRGRSSPLRRTRLDAISVPAASPPISIPWRPGSQHIPHSKALVSHEKNDRLIFSYQSLHMLQIMTEFDTRKLLLFQKCSR